MAGNSKSFKKFDIYSAKSGNHNVLNSVHCGAKHRKHRKKS